MQGCCNRSSRTGANAVLLRSRYLQRVFTRGRLDDDTARTKVRGSAGTDQDLIGYLIASSAPAHGSECGACESGGPLRERTQATLLFPILVVI